MAGTTAVFGPIPVATRILDCKPRGSSNPIFCEFDDEITRIVRFHRGPKPNRFSHGAKSCFNEFIASRLGELFGAPVTHPAVVCVPQHVISPAAATTGAISGLHLGSRKMHGIDLSSRFDNSADLDTNANSDRLLKAAVLLTWLFIEDHAMYDDEKVPQWDNGGFLEYDGSDKRYVLVDLEHAFGTPEWRKESLCDPRTSFILPNRFATNLANLPPEDLQATFNQLASLNAANVISCFQGYPIHWCSQEERDAAIKWLENRRQHLTAGIRLSGYSIEVTTAS
jgi:hypothetical protein